MNRCRKSVAMIDFADKIRAFKEKLELWHVKVKNKKFAFFICRLKCIWVADILADRIFKQFCVAEKKGLNKKN